MASLDWSTCPLFEVIPGKMSGVPLLKNTRLPVDAIIGNYDAFRDDGLSPEEAIAERFSFRGGASGTRPRDRTRRSGARSKLNLNEMKPIAIAAKG